MDSWFQARDSKSGQFALLILYFTFTIENEGPKSNQPQGYEIRHVSFHTSEDKQSLHFTASAPQRFTFEGQPEAQSPSSSSSSPSGFPLSWRVHKKTGRLLEVQNMKEILEHFSANDQEADEAGRRDSFAVTPVDSLELAEAKDNLRDSTKEHVEGMVRSLWDALAEAWLPHRQGFTSDGADIVHKNEEADHIACQRSLEADPSNLREHLRRFVKLEADEPVTSVEFDEAYWRQFLWGNFEKGTMRPLSCIKLDEQKSEHSIQGQPYFLAQTKINFFRLFWDNKTPFDQIRHDILTFGNLANSKVQELTKEYPVIEKQKEKILKNAFDAFDQDGSRSISSSELAQLFAKLGQKIKPDELKLLMEVMDKDGNGSIEWSEFRNYFFDQDFKSQVLSKVNIFFDFGMLENLNVTGYLWKVGGDSSKWTNRIKKKWQKRFCVLDPHFGLLSYYSDESQRNSKANGSIYLPSFSEVKECQLHKGYFDFEIIPSKFGERSYIFSCDTQQERKRWMETINRVMHQEAHSMQEVLQVNSGILTVFGRKLYPKAIFSGILNVKIISGSNLQTPTGEPCDPYCLLLAKEEKLAKTKALSKTANPEWMEEFEVIFENVTHLEFKVKDFEIIHRNRDIATAPFFLGNLEGMVETDSSHVINLEPCGSLLVGFSFPGLQRTSASSGVFGVPIEKVAAEEDRDFPLLIEALINEIEKRDGISEPGIYRLSGSATQVKALKEQLNQDTAKTNLAEVGDIHTLTGTLKLYFRELPDPLFTFERYDIFVGIMASEPWERRDHFYRALKCLPPTNLNTVIFLMNHLYKVVQNSHTNMMSARNVSTCFAPSIIQSPHGGLDINAPMAVIEDILVLWPELVDHLP